MLMLILHNHYVYCSYKMHLRPTAFTNKAKGPFKVHCVTLYYFV